MGFGRKFGEESDIFFASSAFFGKDGKCSFVSFVNRKKQKAEKITKILKNREISEKKRNKMAIDLTAFFIYNYYGGI